MFTIQPGYLVGLRSRLVGGYTYTRVDTENKRMGDEGRLVKWETTKTIIDEEEFAAANKLRVSTMDSIRRICTTTPFGLICPKSRKDDLDKAYDDAESVFNSFNAQARHSMLSIDMLCGEISDTDEKAVAAILSEMRQATEEMQVSIGELDPKAIRRAAEKARDLGRLLDPSTAEKVSEAVKAARRAASQIVKRIENAGEEAGKVLSEQNLTPIETLRFAMLDYETDDGTDRTSENREPTRDPRQQRVEM